MWRFTKKNIFSCWLGSVDPNFELCEKIVCWQVLLMLSLKLNFLNFAYKVFNNFNLKMLYLSLMETESYLYQLKVFKSIRGCLAKWTRLLIISIEAILVLEKQKSIPWKFSPWDDCLIFWSLLSNFLDEIKATSVWAL